MKHKPKRKKSMKFQIITESAKIKSRRQNEIVYYLDGDLGAVVIKDDYETLWPLVQRVAEVIQGVIDDLAEEIGHTETPKVLHPDTNLCSLTFDNGSWGSCATAQIGRYKISVDSTTSKERYEKLERLYSEMEEFFTLLLDIR
jgi:hypothetical protein